MKGRIHERWPLGTPLGFIVGGRPVDLLFHHNNTQWKRVKFPTEIEIFLGRGKGFLSGLKAANTHFKGRNIDSFNRNKMTSEQWLIGVEVVFKKKNLITQEPYKRILVFHLFLSRPSRSHCIHISIERDINYGSVWRMRIKREFLRSERHWITGVWRNSWTVTIVWEYHEIINLKQVIQNADPEKSQIRLSKKSKHLTTSASFSSTADL